MGAVATTFIAGVEAIKAGLSLPIGSLTQMGTIRLGKRTDDRTRASGLRSPRRAVTARIRGWDPIRQRREAARKAGVLEEAARPDPRPPEPIKPMPAVFSTKYVKKLDGPNVKKGANWMELAEQCARTSAVSRRRRSSIAW
jgi:myo-inositol-1-phosphate synthase